MRTWEIIFYSEDKDTWNRIKTGQKKVESRALAPEGEPKDYYGKIMAGDKIRFICENESFESMVSEVRKYSVYEDYLEKEDLENIHGPSITKEKAREMHSKFDGYIERLNKYGIVAIELE